MNAVDRTIRQKRRKRRKELKRIFRIRDMASKHVSRVVTVKDIIKGVGFNDATYYTKKALALLIIEKDGVMVTPRPVPPVAWKRPDKKERGLLDELRKKGLTTEQVLEALDKIAEETRKQPVIKASLDDYLDSLEEKLEE